MRHARTGAVHAADRVPLEQLLEPVAVPVVEPPAWLIAVPAPQPIARAITWPAVDLLVHTGAESTVDSALEPWSWPEAPGLPPTPALRRGLPTSTPAPRTHSRVLPAADQPKRSLPRLRSFRGPSPAERYWLPPITPPTKQTKQPSRARGPLVGLVTAVLLGATWIALAGLTGYALGVLAVVLGALVGAATHRFGRPAAEENVFFAVVWSILGASVGFFATAIQANMSALGVGVGGAIAGSRWNAIVRDVVTAPLNWLYVVLGVVAALYLVRRPGRN